MHYFDTVVVITDPATHELGIALRSVLDAFRIHCDFHQCVQRQRLLRVLGGECAPSQHVVLCVGGWHPPDDEALNFIRMVDLIEGSWQEVGLALTPEVIRDTVRLPGRSIAVLGGCNGGSSGLVEAFLDTGCSHYIAECGDVNGVDADAALLFVIGYFYQLMQDERDRQVACSVPEAVRRAAAMDPLAKQGTHLYRCYTRS
ncbi:hypothetical protein LLH23_23325 [bacterium]|nr:hypothetical protein [bacterium]